MLRPYSRVSPMIEWLAARAEADPQRVALISDGRAWTYAELNAQVRDTAARLDAAGLRRGDRLALLMANQGEYAVLVYAAVRLGAVLVPLNTRLSIPEIAQQVQRTGPRLLIHDETGAPEALSGDPACTCLPVSELGPVPNDTWRFESGTVDLDAPLAIIHTSGTSGQPKGAVLTCGAFYHAAQASAARLGSPPEDRWLCVLPLYHVGGLSILMRAALYGFTVDLYPRFDTDTINHALTHTPVTLVSLVPTMLYRLLEARTGPWSDSLRLVLLGGAAAEPELIQRCQAEGVPVATTYGLTEAASQVATALPDVVAHKPGTVGKPLDGTRVRIVDDDGADVPAGEYGEIVVQGPTLMQGYDGDSQSTARALRDGWLHTGDIGYLDADGDLWPVQRRSDLIVSGGENVYPAEVEAVLRGHPDVLAACVVGAPSAEWGQVVAAAVVLRPGAELTADTLVTYARERLAGYKLPRRVLFVEALPQTASGKVQRAAVAALFERA